MAKRKTSNDKPSEKNATWPTRVLAFFSQLEGRYSGQNAKAAVDNTVGRQSHLHMEFLAFVASLATRTSLERDPSATIANIGEPYVREVNERGKFGRQQIGDGFRVVSESLAPVFREEDIELLKREFVPPDGRESHDLAFLLLAGYVRTARYAAPDQPFSTNPRTSAPFLIAMAQIETAAAFDVPSNYAAAVTQIGGRIAAIGSSLKLAERQVDGVKGKLFELVELNEQNSRYGDAFVAKLEEIKKEQAISLTALREELKLDEARKLWGSRARSSAWAFYISGALLVAVLVGIPLATVIWWSEIIELLRQYEEAVIAGAADDGLAATVAAVGRLLLITAPLGFVVWLVRLVVRFNSRSMLLMDDAGQRVTMLDTYLFLIEQDAAMKQDRGAILEALFRRAPGHGPDTAEPPHFTDLLKYGQDGQTKP